MRREYICEDMEEEKYELCLCISEKFNLIRIQEDYKKIIGNKFENVGKLWQF